MDIRLTRSEISRRRERLRGHRLVRRRTTGSDWVVVVDIATEEGAALALELAEVAARVHAPPPRRPSSRPPAW